MQRRELLLLGLTAAVLPDLSFELGGGAAVVGVNDVAHAQPTATAACSAARPPWCRWTPILKAGGVKPQ